MDTAVLRSNIYIKHSYHVGHNSVKNLIC